MYLLGCAWFLNSFSLEAAEGLCEIPNQKETICYSSITQYSLIAFYFFMCQGLWSLLGFFQTQSLKDSPTIGLFGKYREHWFKEGIVKKKKVHCKTCFHCRKQELNPSKRPWETTQNICLRLFLVKGLRELGCLCHNSYQSLTWQLLLWNVNSLITSGLPVGRQSKPWWPAKQSPPAKCTGWSEASFHWRGKGKEM